MGLPIDRLVIGSNANDILTRFFASGEMEMRGVVPTLSPSMDIQVSSNFERLLFDLFDRRGAEVEATLTGFRRDGRIAVRSEEHTSELQSLMRISSAVYCLKKKETLPS